jgi:DNA-binding transcriptional MerR regulator
VSDRLLTIGELARRAGVATSALRYYEELGLLPAPTRVSGQRRYPESAVGLVGIILLLRKVGPSLAEERRSRHHGPSRSTIAAARSAQARLAR